MVEIQQGLNLTIFVFFSSSHGSSLVSYRTGTSEVGGSNPVKGESHCSEMAA